MYICLQNCDVGIRVMTGPVLLDTSKLIWKYCRLFEDVLLSFLSFYIVGKCGDTIQFYAYSFIYGCRNIKTSKSNLSMGVHSCNLLCSSEYRLSSVLYASVGRAYGSQVVMHILRGYKQRACSLMQIQDAPIRHFREIPGGLL